MKIASHVLYFNQDKWILKYIERVAPFVDKIYVAWSALPWTYNPGARMQFLNKSNPELLKQSPYYDKIELITGTWNLDEEQRNACLDAAKRDDMDYLLIIDADEFYRPEDMIKIVEDIKENPNYDSYLTPYVIYWKDLNHIILHSNGTYIGGVFHVALNIKSNNRFIRCRIPSGNKTKELTSICGHAAYVLTDDECWAKINAWGHAHQFNREWWFNNIWKTWTEESTNLHAIEPHVWKKAVITPKELQIINI